MKTMICEICGNDELIKTDGLFVCQSCGTKYSVEEAKKLLCDKTVSVTVDESDKIINWIELARNAIKVGNCKESEEYCNKILEIDEKNSECWLIKGKSAGWQSSLANKRFIESLECFKNAITFSDKKYELQQIVANEFTSILKGYIDLCCNNYINFPSNDNANAIIDLNTEISVLTASLISMVGNIKPEDIHPYLANKMFLSALGGYTTVRDAYDDSKDREYVLQYEYEKYRDAFVDFINIVEIAIIMLVNDNETKIKYYNALIIETKNFVDQSVCAYCDGVSSYGANIWVKCFQDHYVDKITEYHKKIKEISPNYSVPDRHIPTNNYLTLGNSDGSPLNGKSIGSTSHTENSSQEGCYIATAIYGSYDCPQVWTLRRYRDNTLAHTWYGKIFIRIYYAISPTLVKHFGQKEYFKRMWKRKLDHMVYNLQSNGIESTPYEDKKW